MDAVRVIRLGIDRRTPPIVVFPTETASMAARGMI